MVMSPIGDSSGTWQGAAQNAVARARDLQKLKGLSGLHSDLAGDPSPRQQPRSPGNPATLPCSGTQQGVPFRHAPRLTAPFVAQLLGQLLPDRERPGSEARTVYGAERHCTSLLLDTRL